MSEKKDRRLEDQREKIEAEIARSLSVVKMKETHKQIEDVEKLRKQTSIKSICERISHCSQQCEFALRVMSTIRKKYPTFDLDHELLNGRGVQKHTNAIRTMYDSIYFDLERTLDIKKEDFDRLFPKLEFDFSTYRSILPNMQCLNMQLRDMKNYCLRFL